MELGCTKGSTVEWSFVATGTATQVSSQQGRLKHDWMQTCLERVGWAQSLPAVPRLAQGYWRPEAAVRAESSSGGKVILILYLSLRGKWRMATWLQKRLSLKHSRGYIPLTHYIQKWKYGLLPMFLEHPLHRLCTAGSSINLFLKKKLNNIFRVYGK